MTLAPGLTTSEQFTVEGLLLTDVGGTLGRSVLSTPGMIGVMERTAAMLVFQYLPAGAATVGFEVHVKHVGAAVEGETCTVSATLKEVVEERKLRFEVAVTCGERTVGIGTHERRVVAAGAR